MTIRPPGTEKTCLPAGGGGSEADGEGDGLGLGDGLGDGDWEPLGGASLAGAVAVAVVGPVLGDTACDGDDCCFGVEGEVRRWLGV